MTEPILLKESIIGDNFFRMEKAPRFFLLKYLDKKSDNFLVGWKTRNFNQKCASAYGDILLQIMDGYKTMIKYSPWDKQLYDDASEFLRVLLGGKENGR